MQIYQAAVTTQPGCFVYLKKHLTYYYVMQTHFTY